MSFQFQLDISTETSKNCCSALSHNAPETKSKKEYSWPLFKEWFAEYVSAYVAEYDFRKLMNMVSVENPQPNIGKVFEYAINLYFDRSITSAFKHMEGCNRFATMNRELSSLSGFGEVVMLKNFMRNYDSYSWEELIDEIQIISYFHPCLSEFAGVLCCGNIPQNELSSFLRISNWYTDTDRINNLHHICAPDIRRTIEKCITEAKTSDKTEEAFIVEKQRENEKFR